MKIENLQEFEWIRNNVKPIDNRNSELWRGNTVGNLLPEKFDKYLKILHPMYKDKFVQDKKLSWDEVGDVEGVPGERILWRHLATEMNIEFKPEINLWAIHNAFARRWPRYLIGAQEGCLEERCLQEMVRILEPFSKKTYYIYFDIMKTCDFEEQLFAGQLDDLKLAMNYKTIKNYSDTEKYSPTYIWSDDKEICINTDYDLQFTLVGCSSRLLKEIIKNEYLECIEVEYTTRIDYKAME
jgi:hypothetical protein